MYDSLFDDLPSWQSFTRKLFETEDSDPGYMAISRCGLPMAQRKRICVAWCAYYNLGIASEASQYTGKDFWKFLSRIYQTAKRNTERRHFRGAAGMLALQEWERDFPQPEAMIDRLLGCEPEYKAVYKAMRPIRQMGTYFMWKFCDIYDVLSGKKVNVLGSEDKMPELPKRGSKLLFPDLSYADACAKVVAFARKHGMTAPPHHNRPFCVNEAETVFCVYKQMQSGGYTYGLRTAKAVRRLSAHPCEASKAMLKGLLHRSPWTTSQLNDIFTRHNS